jgi:hypothetical protein
MLIRLQKVVKAKPPLDAILRQDAFSSGGHPKNKQDFKRELTAIMSTQVAGYSRITGKDEAATVKTLEAYKQVWPL